MDKRGLKIKLKALYFFVCGSSACVAPFLTVFFREKGFTFEEIGILLGENSLVGVLFQPIWGFITDKFLNKKKTMMLAIAMSGAAVFGIIFSKSYSLVFAALILFSMFQCSIGSVMDAYCYEILEVNKKLQYGRIRLMGSIGYAIIVFLMGMAAQVRGISFSFYAYSVVMVISLVTLNSINFTKKGKTQTLSFKDVGDLLKNKYLMIFIFSVLVSNIAQGSNGNFISILIEKTGGDASQIGIVWFVVAMSELPVFFLGNKIIKKFGVLNIYCFSALMFIVRYTLDSLCTSYVQVIMLQMMQSITFTLYVISSLQYINIVVPKKMRTTGMTLFAALGGGLGGFIGNLSGGIILQQWNVFYLYRIMALCSVLMFAAGASLKIMNKKIVINPDLN